MTIQKRRGASIIFAGVSILGTIATGYLARKSALKEIQLRDDIFRDDYAAKQETPKEVVFKHVLKLYIPSIFVAALSVSSIVGSVILSRKNEASLMAMALVADRGWRKYKNTVKDIFGLNRHTHIIKGMAIDDHKKENFTKLKKDDKRKLFYLEHIGFFLADPEKLAFSYGDINQRLHIEDYGKSSYNVTLKQFLEQADAELISDNVDPEALEWGWTAEYLQEVYDHIWIHIFFYDEMAEDGSKYTVIEWGEEPIIGGDAFGDFNKPRIDPPEDNVFSLGKKI